MTKRKQTIDIDERKEVKHEFWYRWNRTYYKVLSTAQILITPKLDEYGFYDTDWTVRIYNTDFPNRSFIAEFEVTTQYDEKPTRQDIAYAWMKNVAGQSVNMLTECYDTDPT